MVVYRDVVGVLRIDRLFSFLPGRSEEEKK